MPNKLAIRWVVEPKSDEVIHTDTNTNEDNIEIKKHSLQFHHQQVFSAYEDNKLVCKIDLHVDASDTLNSLKSNYLQHEKESFFYSLHPVFVENDSYLGRELGQVMEKANLLRLVDSILVSLDPEDKKAKIRLNASVMRELVDLFEKLNEIAGPFPTNMKNALAEWVAKVTSIMPTMDNSQFIAQQRQIEKGYWRLSNIWSNPAPQQSSPTEAMDVEPQYIPQKRW